MQIFLKKLSTVTSKKVCRTQMEGYKTKEKALTSIIEEDCNTKQHEERKNREH
jgi:hypothetical protein